ncbi:MAG: isoprenylcysteine carboxylmethyltransferase family protein [Opitutaceae bacterium]|jgi:protein-S-isoprenylcysteine O-methyltransferase Ste14|nr:isoprenylcysteine carboxylmethyltransferase family protein [Opitutaceae bacterium]
MTTHAQPDSPATPSAWAVFLTRRRKPLSRILAACFFTLLVFTRSPGQSALVLVLEIIGILLISIAVLGRIWCALYIAGRKNKELCSDGPYSICRNPLYLFSFAGGVGFAFAASSPPLGLALIPVFWGYHHFVIKTEEARLRLLFGAAYGDYCAKVPRILPNAGLYWSRPNLTIAPRVILRAMSEAAWFLVALACFEMIEHLKGASLGDTPLPALFTWPF